VNDEIWVFAMYGEHESHYNGNKICVNNDIPHTEDTSYHTCYTEENNLKHMYSEGLDAGYKMVFRIMDLGDMLPWDEKFLA